MSQTRVIAAAAVAALIAVLAVWGPPPKRAATGNTLRVVSTSPPDSLDPAMAYMVVSWQMMFNVYDGLLTYHKEAGDKGAQLTPDLATAMPVMSDGGKTVSMTMRKGVKFAPPVNREVLPSDIKYGMERVLRMASPGSGFFLNIEGAQDVADKKAKTISGIEIDDTKRTISFHLLRPDATFLYVLALQFSVAIPKGTPLEDVTSGTLIPGTGPYMFTKYVPLRSITMKRNPNFTSWSPAVPDGNIDGVNIQIGVTPENSVTMMKQNKADLMIGADLPRAMIPSLTTDPHWKKNLHVDDTSITSYIFMNYQLPPFNNLKMRQAINWAIDRRALVKISGGLATPTENILPPVMPGYRKHNYYPKPDMAKAKALVKESGITPGKIDIWCRTTPPVPDLAVYLQDVMIQLGFKPTVKCIDPANYFTLVGNESTKALIGFGNWGQDFPEGSNFIDVLLNGKRITKEHSNNLSWYNGADKEIDAANRLMDQTARNKAWGDIDDKIVKDGGWAPFSNRIQYTMVSDRVDNFTYSPVYDMLFMRVKLKGAKNATVGSAGRVKP